MEISAALSRPAAAPSAAARRDAAATATAAVDAGGEQFATALKRSATQRTIEVPRLPGDLDGNGALDEKEQLLERIKHLIDVLTADIGRKGTDPARYTKAIANLGQLASQLEERIVDGGAISQQDLTDISEEVTNILMWATQRPDAEWSDPDESSHTDGVIEWRSERTEPPSAKELGIAALLARVSTTTLATIQGPAEAEP